MLKWVTWSILVKIFHKASPTPSHPSKNTVKWFQPKWNTRKTKCMNSSQTCWVAPYPAYGPTGTWEAQSPYGVRHCWLCMHWASSPSRFAHQPHNKPQPHLRPVSGRPPDWSFPRQPLAGGFQGWHRPTTQEQGPAVWADLIWSLVFIAECTLSSQVLLTMHLTSGRSQQVGRRRSNTIAFIFTYGKPRHERKTDLQSNFLIIFLA